jgi:hypothetical protein
MVGVFGGGRREGILQKILHGILHGILLETKKKIHFSRRSRVFANSWGREKRGKGGEKEGKEEKREGRRITVVQS